MSDNSWRNAPHPASLEANILSAYCREIKLHNVTFAVRAIGRLKSTIDHAGMRGDLVSYKPDVGATKTMRAITYNPLKHACFITRGNCLPTYSASHVIGPSTVDNRASVFAATLE